MTLVALAGPKAYSSFRINALINNINHSLNSSAVVAIRSVYVHYVNVAPGSDMFTSSDSTKRDLLDSLLEYDTPADTSDPLTQTLLTAIKNSSNDLPENSYILRVIPRPGTISPWSSKATNIAHICGLDRDVLRLERGIALVVQVRKGFPFEEYLKSGVFLEFVYDRMTQVCCCISISLLLPFFSIFC